MCQDLAGAPIRGSARISTYAARGKLRPSLAFGRPRKANAYRNRASMARIWATLYSAATSFVAQQCLAEEASMVRRRIAADLAPPRRRDAVALILFALWACAPVLAPRGSGNNTPGIQESVFVTRDGLRLPLRHWDAQKPVAVIVALHGM